MADSHIKCLLPSVVYFAALVCLITSNLVLRGGMESKYKNKWSPFKVKRTANTLEILYGISIIVGSIIFNITSKKQFILILFLMGACLGNFILYFSYIVIIFTEQLGYIVTYIFMGASLPCLINISFSHLSDNKDYFKYLSVNVGLILGGWITAQLFSMRILMDHTDDRWQLSPILLSTSVLILVVLNVFLKTKLTPIESMKDENKDETSFYEKFFHAVTMISILACVALFYFVKYQLISCWMELINMVMIKVGDTVYSANTLNEQYLLSTLLSCIIITLVSFRSGSLHSIECILCGIGITLYTMHLSNDVMNQIKHRYNDRQTSTDYTNAKFVFINTATTQVETILPIGNSDGRITLELDSMAQLLMLRIFDQGYSFQGAGICHHDVNQWYCQEVIMTYHDDHSKNVPCCTFEDLSHDSTLFAYVCYNIQYNNIQMVLISTDGLVIELGSKRCMFVPPGKYTVRHNIWTIIEIDTVYLDAGGSYFMYETHDWCYMVSFQKPLTINIIFLLPLFILLGIAEVLLFVSCLVYMFSAPAIKSHVIILAIFFGLTQFAFVWHLNHPSSSFDIQRHFSMLIFLFFFGGITIGLAKYFHMNCDLWGPRLWLAFKNFMLHIYYKLVGWFKITYGFVYKYFLQYFFKYILYKCIAKNYDKALKYGMSSAECGEDSDDESYKLSHMAKKEEKRKKPPPPPPPPKESVPYEDVNARGISGKHRLKKLGDDKNKGSAGQRGVALHNPKYGEDFLETIEK